MTLDDRHNLIIDLIILKFAHKHHLKNRNNVYLENFIMSKL